MRSPREDDADALARHLGTGLHHHGSRSELAPAEKGRHKRVRALAVVLALGLLRAAQVSYARADETTRALVHLFYQAPAILIAAVWLWGANLFLWRRLRFDPHPLAVFQLEDARARLTHARVGGVARASSLLYLASLAAFLRLANGAAREEEPPGTESRDETPRGFVAAHAPSSRRRRTSCPRSRSAHRSTAGTRVRGGSCGPRWCGAPTPWRRPVSFADFFLADVLCSLAKTLSDAERSACAALAGPAAMFARHRDARFGACGSTSWHVPLVSWRCPPRSGSRSACGRRATAACWRRRRAERGLRRRSGSAAKRAARLNALKYFSAFPVVLLSHLKYSVSSETWTATCARAGWRARRPTPRTPCTGT